MIGESRGEWTTEMYLWDAIFGGIMLLFLGTGVALIRLRGWTGIMLIHVLAAVVSIALAGIGVGMMVHYKYEQGWLNLGVAIGVAATIAATIIASLATAVLITLLMQGCRRAFGRSYSRAWRIAGITLPVLHAVVLGVGLAIAFSLSKWIEYSFFPYAVVLQVTPIVAIAPLIITMLNDLDTALLVCAWIVAFFPILSNTIIGLRSVDHGLLDLYQMYGASRWRVMLDLRLPSALPYFLAALKISAGLSLIGAVVGEFVAYGQSPGLAARIVEASYLLKVPRMFAALVLISVTGILLFLLFSFVSNLALRSWHESAVRREN